MQRGNPSKNDAHQFEKLKLEPRGVRYIPPFSQFTRKWYTSFALSRRSTNFTVVFTELHYDSLIPKYQKVNKDNGTKYLLLSCKLCTTAVRIKCHYSISFSNSPNYVRWSRKVCGCRATAQNLHSHNWGCRTKSNCERSAVQKYSRDWHSCENECFYNLVFEKISKTTKKEQSLVK